MTTLRFAWAVLISSATACGGSGSGGIALDNLGTEVSEASCAKLFDCCNQTELMEEFDGITVGGQPITTEAQCVQFTSAFFTAFLTEGYKASIAAGRIEYNGEAAAGCIALIDDLSCSEYAMHSATDMPPACEPFIVPLVADDGACTQDYECMTDNCVGATVQPNGPNTDGACKPRAAIGQACSGSSDSCVDGAFCEFGSTGSTCVALKADGQTCTSNSQCASDHCAGESPNPRMCGTPAPRCDGA